ncbi:uncharacterized protein N7473_009332 [Penicillium subrubescens]|uniref:Uncharacterized protein n=1 Tax=Penicillium subrubescens TaxID=1316194 RepID=A0A1Q5TAQ3_9EURO|nr:uncharacterized protein N7473_009332 [Penicillium subrubescens]KAJ5886658.1 hypothetical protein N7473_009332 [Penicillium subrubescens]OKO97327.1 hypothetical protein PENSUB_10121 [Penicillium subrubescens]
MAGCTVKTFFKEAREFYQNAEADGGMALHLKMPSLLQERYMQESFEEEFDILCEEVMKLVLIDQKDRIVEVSLQRNIKIEEVEIEQVKMEEVKVEDVKVEEMKIEQVRIEEKGSY